MKETTWIRIAITFILLIFACPSRSQEQTKSKGIFYGSGTWNGEMYGNHRAVVFVAEKSDAVRIHIPWRRRDSGAGSTTVIVVDAATEKRVANVFLARMSRESGDIVFQPQTVPGNYYIYYLPYISSGSSHYPNVSYRQAEPMASAQWLNVHRLKADRLLLSRIKAFPMTRLLEIQSLGEFDSFFPMEVIATAAEVDRLLKKHPAEAFIVFPEDRRFPIRMGRDLPLRWKAEPFRDGFRGEAAAGEFYTFQLGVYAARMDLAGLGLDFSDLLDSDGMAILPADAFRCINLQGMDWRGRPWKKALAVARGRIQPLWIGISLPKELLEGEYRSEILVNVDNVKGKKIPLRIKVKAPMASGNGDGQLWRFSRLRWLDSQLAADDTLIRPFTSLEVIERTISCLGRKVGLASNGLPESMASFFAPEMTRISQQGRELLQAPMRLKVESANSNAQPSEYALAFTKKGEAEVAWESQGKEGPFSVHCRGSMEFDGYLEFDLELTAERSESIADIRLEIPLKAEVARYMMGLGFKGGLRPQRFSWKWDTQKNQDALWIGEVNAGLQVALRDESYVRPLNTNFYLLKPLRMPSSWCNNGNGGCVVEEVDAGTVRLTAFSGPREVKAGDRLHFIFSLLFTPFKTIDTAGQWSTRYYHEFQPIPLIAASGANTVNVHHATDVNPYINYPFLRTEEMKKYVGEAHERGMKVKIYYTVRELSNHAAELFPLFSLGEEIFASGPGKGYSWLQEHLEGNYIPGWVVPERKDAALITSGVSRWHNYYIEGLAWLAAHTGIDGLYLDDVAFDRSVMKRVRRVLDAQRPDAQIDLHSANQYNERDGFASSANLYLEHFPYLNRLWFGEYFDYNAAADYWLVEISGIPFGLMGEMLQDGGNPWRGMLYGMTNRLPWSGDPRPIWKLWDEFGIRDSRMIGYWVPQAPIRTDSPDVLATAYVKDNKVLIALASWAKEKKHVRLAIDWPGLGFAAKRATLHAPMVPGLQTMTEFRPAEAIPVEPGKGWWLVLEEK